MINGLASFKEWFHGYENHYVIIGGTACDLLMGEAGRDFRATKDIDMVLIVETLTADFGIRFWEYVKAAGYNCRHKSTGAPQLHRFSKPRSTEYPYMIELFSRRLERIELPSDALLTPLPVADEASSLSAILLDDQYYSFLKSGVRHVRDIPILGAEHLIPFKAKAWLDLTKRKAENKSIDSKNIRKHKNDIMRLSELLSPGTTFELPSTLKDDLHTFLSVVKESTATEKEKLSRVAATYGL
jgi:hypothetical protein